MKAASRPAEEPRALALQPWEIEHLRSGREPKTDLWEFYLFYESGDWRGRWKAVQEWIVGEWLCRPVNERPRDWIRYLVRFGYLSREVGDLLLQPSRSTTADEDPSTAVMPV